MGLFAQLHEAGNTIILVTHEADVAAHAHRVIHIRDGQVEKDVKRAGLRQTAAKCPALTSSRRSAAREAVPHQTESARVSAPA